MQRTVLVWLGVASGALCLATGATYVTTSSTSEMPDAFIATLALLGGLALAGAALWQQRSVGDARRLPLVTLAVLAAGYAAANGLGVSIAQLEWVPDKISGAAAALHAVGVGAGAVLFLATIAALVSHAVESGPASAPTDDPPAHSGFGVGRD